jgi:FimV-like protein
MYLPKVISLVVLLLYLPLSHADQTYGPLRNGETLWTIAPKVKPSDTISRHQMIIALLRTNPHAFRLPCNINSLKIKQTLTVPSLAEIEKITHQQALAAYNEQNTAWKAYRKQGVEIKCNPEPAPTTAVTTDAEESTENTENTLVAMNAQPAKEVVVVDDGVDLPKLSTPFDIEETKATTTDDSAPESEMPKQQLEEEVASSQLAQSMDKKKINYLPVIIVLGVVLFVLILAFLFRNHSENKPIPEDLT